MPDPRTAHEGNISLDRMDVHEHAALFFQTQEERDRCLCRMVCLACQRDEACIFVMRREDDESVRNVLSMAGLKRDCLSKDGRISLVDPREELTGQEGSASLLLDFIGGLIDQSLDKGYTAVRLFNDMDLLGELLAEPDLMMYESLSSELFDEKNAIGLCLVNATTGGPSAMRSIVTHPTLIIRGFACSNHFFMPPDELSRLFGSLPSIHFILDKLLEIQMSARGSDSSEEDLKKLNSMLQKEIEKRQMVEWALLRSENDYRAAMNAFPDVVLVTDNANRIIIVNDAFLSAMDVIGYDGRVIGENLQAILPFLSKDLKGELEEIIMTRSSMIGRQNLTIGEAERAYEIRRYPIKDGEEVGRVMTIVRNISGPLSGQGAPSAGGQKAGRGVRLPQGKGQVKA
ncbi:MAG: MEDS domain-containing protein [Euryarchaeota archaeon]|nr:MEDS domain-containing protein [Euryarchaeota archaeon]